MRGVKLAGWLITMMVLALLGTDLYSVLVKGATHPVVTWEHVALLIVGVCGIGMASDETSNRIVRMAGAVRGGRRETDPK